MRLKFLTYYSYRYKLYNVEILNVNVKQATLRSQQNKLKNNHDLNIHYPEALFSHKTIIDKKINIKFLFFVLIYCLKMNTLSL